MIKEDLRAMQNRITEFLKQEFRAFEKEHGVTPQSVDVALLDVTTHTDDRQRKEVGFVHIRFGI